MISKIILENVASYKKPTELETNKRINLIYGLNGTGKSTLSNYLHQILDERYADCTIEGLDDNHEILVYNQNFIRENFFEAENLNGIFTLSKENKQAKLKIQKAEKQIEELEGKKEIKNKELEEENTALDKKQEVAKDVTWEIKKSYTGGDRILEFCLQGYKSDSNKLFSFITGIPKPKTKPKKSIDDLKNDLQSISGENAQKCSILSEVSFTSQSIESEALFAKQVVGNENSTVSELIKKLGNSDWVKTGLQYLPTEPIEKNTACPFCQEETISNKLVEAIKSYFDASYEADIKLLESFLEDYSRAIESIPKSSAFEANPKFENYKKDFQIKYSAFTKVIESNKKIIEDKIKSPSVSVTLESSTQALEELNKIIKNINLLVAEHNKNIDQKTTVKAKIKNTFWELMRWEYDQTISSFHTDKAKSKSKMEGLEDALNEIDLKIKDQNDIILEQQEQTINIDGAITSINNGLVDLGTDYPFMHLLYSQLLVCQRVCLQNTVCLICK